jgi:hypothetical protein
MPANYQLHAPRQTHFGRFLFSDDRVPLKVKTLIRRKDARRSDIFPIHGHLAHVVEKGGLLEKNAITRREVKMGNERICNRRDAAAVRGRVPLEFVDPGGQTQQFFVDFGGLARYALHRPSFGLLQVRFKSTQTRGSIMQ